MTSSPVPGPPSSSAAVAPPPGAGRRPPRGGLPPWSWVVLAAALVVGVVGSALLGTALGRAAGRDVDSVVDRREGPWPGHGRDDDPLDARAPRGPEAPPTAAGPAPWALPGPSSGATGA